jgi:hypothetical protein
MVLEVIGWPLAVVAVALTVWYPDPQLRIEPK